MCNVSVEVSDNIDLLKAFLADVLVDLSRFLPPCYGGCRLKATISTLRLVVRNRILTYVWDHAVCVYRHIWFAKNSTMCYTN